VDSASVTVTMNAPPTVSISETMSISCFGDMNGELKANASGGLAPYNYLWNTSSTDSTISGLGTGNYSVIVTDNNGCKDTASYNLTQPMALAIDTMIVNGANCNLMDGSLNVSVSGGTMPYSYNWSNGDTTAVADSLAPGTHSVTITDANGCSISVLDSIPEINIPAVSSVFTNPNCFGEATGSIMTTMTSGTAPFTYIWSDGDTTPNRTGLFAGYYFLTVTDANGCMVTNVDTLTSPSPILLNFSQVEPTCYDSTGSLTVLPVGGIAPYTYLWNTGDTTQTIDSLPQGNYQVTVTDANGCQEASSVLFLNAGLPVATFNITIVGNNVQFDANAINVVNFLWNFGNGDTSSMVSPQVTYDSSGTYTVSLIISNACGTDTLKRPLFQIQIMVNSA
jgi:hypothetical protein